MGQNNQKDQKGPKMTAAVMLVQNNQNNQKIWSPHISHTILKVRFFWDTLYIMILILLESCNVWMILSQEKEGEAEAGGDWRCGHSGHLGNFDFLYGNNIVSTQCVESRVFVLVKTNQLFLCTGFNKRKQFFRRFFCTVWCGGQKIGYTSKVFQWLGLW